MNSDQSVATLVKARQEAEAKVHAKSEVGQSWMAENVKYIEREKFIDALLEKRNITDLDHKLFTELSETEKKTETKKILLKQTEEYINFLQKNLEEAKEEQQILVTQLAKEKEFQKRLKEKTDEKRAEQKPIGNINFESNSLSRAEVDCGPQRRHYNEGGESSMS